MELYYLQDNRSYVGNDMLWWAKDGRGYTTDLSKAHVYTKEEAVKQNQSRETDIPWPKEYIDERIRPAVDMQYCDKTVALKGSGIKLRKPRKRRKPVFNCGWCGIFMSEIQYYTEKCSKCGKWNLP